MKTDSEPKQSKTPRTDAETVIQNSAFCHGQTMYRDTVSVDFARDLERENQRLLEQIENGCHDFWKVAKNRIKCSKCGFEKVLTPPSTS